MDSPNPEPEERTDTEADASPAAPRGRRAADEPAADDPSSQSAVRPRPTRSRSRRPPPEASPSAKTTLAAVDADSVTVPVESVPAAAEKKRARKRRPPAEDAAMTEARATDAPADDAPADVRPGAAAVDAPEPTATTDRASSSGVPRAQRNRPARPGREPRGTGEPSPRDADARAGANGRPRDGEPDVIASKLPRPAVHRRAFPSEHLDEDALKVLRRLHRNGYKAYLVGGCVRDLLLGRKPKDFDVATSARPGEVKDIFRNCRVIGRRFRLAHILFGGGKVIETATFRRDPSAAADEDTFVAEVEDAREALDGGELDVVSIAGKSISRGSGALRPSPKARDDDADLLIRHDNVFGEPHEDALRRDFTINGLFYDVERGEVIDYVGGLRDLERRAIDTIGLPDVRFREDPVRILRAIKFSARLDLGIDPDCYDAMVAQREELRKCAAPRLLEEILRLLRGGAAHRSVWLSWETGVLSVVLPDLAVFLDDDAPSSRLLWGRLDAIDASIRAGRVPSDPVLLAAVLLGPVEEAIEGARDPSSAYEDFMHDVTESLAVPRRMKEKMRAIIGSQRRLRAGRVGSLSRRDFFAEAVHLFELDSAARGQRVPDLLADVRLDPDADVVVRRRRRRPRR